MQKMVKYEMQIIDVELLHYYGTQISVKVKSKLTITLLDAKIEKIISNTVYINSDHELYKMLIKS